MTGREHLRQTGDSLSAWGFTVSTMTRIGVHDPGICSHGVDTQDSERAWYSGWVGVCLGLNPQAEIDTAQTRSTQS